MQNSRSLSTKALVLKRSNLGEYDRLVTLLTPELGKVAVLAKGVRRMASTQRGSLEPGCVVQAFILQTKGMPILTQTRLITDSSSMRMNLVGIRQLTQVLEIVDRMFVEDFSEVALFEQVLDIISSISVGESGRAKRGLEVLIEALGYPSLSETNHTSILAYVAELVERPLHSFEYLRVPVEK